MTGRDLTVDMLRTSNGFLPQMLRGSDSIWQRNSGHLRYAKRQIELTAFCDFQCGSECFGKFLEA